MKKKEKIQKETERKNNKEKRKKKKKMKMTQKKRKRITGIEKEGRERRRGRRSCRILVHVPITLMATLFQKMLTTIHSNINLM